jgi:carbon monoxide dehydrogenase subunit G
MTSNSEFKSRTGKVSCSAQEVFDFVTDIRNFEQFIPVGTIDNWQADKESCSFSVSMLGTVSFRLTEKELSKKVVFCGDALKKNDFELTLNITGDMSSTASVEVVLNADLNPMLKVMASKPIGKFLENLIIEMEAFRGWKDLK